MSEHLDLGIGISAAGAQQSERSTRSLLGTLKDYIKKMVSFRKENRKNNEVFSTHLSQSNQADEVYNKIGDSLRKLRNRLLAFIGVYAVSDVFKRAIEEGKELEQLYVRMANRLGSTRFGKATSDWIIEMENRLPIARDELVGFVEAMDKFAIPPQMTNLRGVLNAALGPAGDLNSAVSSITSLAESGDVIPFIEAFNHRLSPGEIARSLQGAVTVQERIISLTNLLDERFQGNIERQQQTVEGQRQLLSGMFNLFKQAFIGDPHVAGTFFGEWSRFVQNFTNWFLEKEEQLVAFGRELGLFFGNIFRLFRQSFFSLGDFSERMFRIMRRFVKNSHELVNPFVLFLAIVIERMKNFFGGFATGFKGFFKFMASTIDAIVEKWAWLLREVFGIDTEEQLSKLREIFSNLLDPKILERLGEAAGFAFGAFVAFVAISGLISKLAGAFTALGKAVLFLFGGFLGLSPWIAGTIAALTALWIAYDENLFGLKDLLEPVFEWLKEQFNDTGDLIQWLSDLGQSVTGVLKKWWGVVEDIWSVAADAVMEFWNSISDNIPVIINNIKSLKPVFLSFVSFVTTQLDTVFDIIKNLFVLGWDMIVTNMKAGWETLQGILKILIGILSGDLPLAWEGFKQLIGGVEIWFKGVFGALKTFVVNLFGDILNNWWEHAQRLGDIWKEVFERVINWLKDAFAGAVDSFKGAIEAALIGIKMKFDQFIGKPFRAIRDWFGFGGEEQSTAENREPISIPAPTSQPESASPSTTMVQPLVASPTPDNFVETHQGGEVISNVEVASPEASILLPQQNTANSRTVNDNRRFTITVQQAPGESPEQTARRIYKELAREERRSRERKGNVE